MVFILLQNNNTFLSTKTILFIVTVSVVLLFFGSAISNQIFAKEEVENGSFTQKSNIYEGLGIKIKYFNPWTILKSSDNLTCYTKDFCMLTLGKLNGEGIGQIWIKQDREDSPKIVRECQCNTLEDYVRYIYTNTISKFDNFNFISDNQTILSIGNRSTIQLEYEFSFDDIQIHAFTIFTKDSDDNSFYHFTYFAIPQTFSKYLDDFKQIINSLEFVSADNETNKKQPSFMSKVEETSNSNSTLLFIDENENPQDLLKSDNKKQQQQQKQQVQQQQQKQQQEQQQKVLKQQEVIKQQQQQQKQPQKQ
jgi:hypothetical protein